MSVLRRPGSRATGRKHEPLPTQRSNVVARACRDLGQRRRGPVALAAKARQDNPPGVDLDSLSEAQLERLHAGLVKLASMDDTVLAALVEQVLADDELGSSA